jgi:hypothetical protein
MPPRSRARERFDRPADERATIDAASAREDRSSAPSDPCHTRIVRLWIAPVAISATVFALALSSRAMAQRASDFLDLGHGLGVERVPRPCWNAPSAICWFWRPIGFAFAAYVGLEEANAFARTPRGRIVAAIPLQMMRRLDVPGRLVRPAGVLYTDDLGATWHSARWPDPLLSANAIAFDPTTSYGVAVGDGIWTSEDEGQTWRRRRSGSGIPFVRVVVRGHTVIVEDRNGALWRSPDGGFALESLAGPGARIEPAGNEVRIVTSDRTFLLNDDGVLRRE